MTCLQSHGQRYPHQCKLNLFHQETCVFKVTENKDYFNSLMCLSEDSGLPYNFTDQHEVETGALGTCTTKITVLFPYTWFSGLLSWPVRSQARKNGTVLFQKTGAKCREEFFPVPWDLQQNCHRKLLPALQFSSVVHPFFLSSGIIFNRHISFSIMNYYAVLKAQKINNPHH